jgi:hypothetical protein
VDGLGFEDKFEPYTHMQQEYPEARPGPRQLIEDATRIEKGVYIYVNNRLALRRKQ